MISRDFNSMILLVFVIGLRSDYVISDTDVLFSEKQTKILTVRTCLGCRGAQRTKEKNHDPGKVSPTLLPPAKNDPMDLLSPKITFSVIIVVGHQDVLID